MIAARTLTDAVMVDALLATRGTPEGLYGRRKMVALLHAPAGPGTCSTGSVENRRLREDVEILRKASVFFAGELDPRNR